MEKNLEVRPDFVQVLFPRLLQNLFYQDHLYQELNGETIGDGGLNDLSICNGKIYLLTPSSASSRAQIVECDAQTLKKERVITAEGFNTSSLGEIYNLLAVSTDKFYVGNNNSGANNVSGVNVLTVQPDGQNTFVPLSGTSGSIGVDGPCWSRMLKVGKNVYIGCGNKLKVFDSETDKELTSIMIAEDRQMGDEIVILENDADLAIAIGIPIPVGIARRRLSVDDDIAGCVLVQAAYDVQKRRLSAPGGTEDSHKSGVAKSQGDSLECLNGLIVLDLIFLDDIFEKQHVSFLLETRKGSFRSPSSY